MSNFDQILLYKLRAFTSKDFWYWYLRITSIREGDHENYVPMRGGLLKDCRAFCWIIEILLWVNQNLTNPPPAIDNYRSLTVSKKKKKFQILTFSNRFRSLYTVHFLLKVSQLCFYLQQQFLHLLVRSRVKRVVIVHIVARRRRGRFITKGSWG